MTPGRLFCRTYVFLVTMRIYAGFFNTHPFYVDMKCGKNDKYGRVLVHTAFGPFYD
jgi:hypothetical protein